MVRRDSPSFLLLAGLLMLCACDLTSDGDNSPEPETLDHHVHLVILYVHTINQASDTLGVVSVTANTGILLASRDAVRQLSRKSVTIGSSPEPMRIVYPDSGMHACSTYVEHYVGYQTRYGGDTVRFGEMDRYGTWGLQLAPHQVCATFADGDSASVYAGVVAPLPDTVRPGGTLELDVTVDLNGLLVWQPSASRYDMRPDHVHVTQR